MRVHCVWGGEAKFREMWGSAEGCVAPPVQEVLPVLTAQYRLYFRYQYDPNQRVCDAMTHIWRSLVDDPKATVEEHYGGWAWGGRGLLEHHGGRGGLRDH